MVFQALDYIFNYLLFLEFILLRAPLHTQKAHKKFIQNLKINDLDSVRVNLGLWYSNFSSKFQGMLSGYLRPSRLKIEEHQQFFPLSFFFGKLQQVLHIYLGLEEASYLCDEYFVLLQRILKAGTNLASYFDPFVISFLNLNPRFICGKFIIGCVQ